MPKIRQKYPDMVTVIEQPPQWQNSSPRWEIEDYGRRYLFQKRCFFVLYIVGVLDYIRLGFEQ